MSDSIDEQLLDYYQRELTWLRQAGADFAERYPKIASRLELAPGECPDPHVERLLEGFSLLCARLQRRLDDGYAEFSNALLEQLYPLALRPLPSCAIARLEPDPSKGNLSEGYALPRDTPLFVTTAAGDSVHFRSTAPVTLWPLEVAEVVLLDTEETQALTGAPLARAALRLRLRNLAEAPWGMLPIRTLRIHLAGSPVTAAALYDLLCGNALQTVCGLPGRQPSTAAGRPEPVGFAPTKPCCRMKTVCIRACACSPNISPARKNSPSSICRWPFPPRPANCWTSTFCSTAHRLPGSVCAEKISPSAAYR